MKQELINKLSCWLNNAPESYHSCDNERLFSAIKYAYKNNLLDELYSIGLKEMVKNSKQEWRDDDILQFVDEWECRISFLVELLESMQEDETIPDYRHK